MCLTQELVNENKNALANQKSVQLTEAQKTEIHNEVAIDPEKRCFYSSKIARKNIKALALCAKDLLQPLTNVLFESPDETRKHLKVASFINWLE